MLRYAFLVFMLAFASSFEIQQELTTPPRTHIGDDNIACHPETSPQNTNGFATYFSDNTYACQNWNRKAKSLPDCFVALNGVCGMKQSYCDKCILMFNSQGAYQKCRVIDFCDPKNCDFLDSGHLDILDNNNRANYKFVDKGKNVEPYPGAGGQPVIKWHWTQC